MVFERKYALLSVHDKTGLLDLVKALVEANYSLIGSGGTAKLIRDGGFKVTEVSELTGVAEFLGGRVKTLHPKVHGAILSRGDAQDRKDLEALGIEEIDVVVCNLYPFQETVANPRITLDAAIEEIDIGGVALCRAAAKNHKRVTILSKPSQYFEFAKSLKQNGHIDVASRRRFALEAFEHTSQYDEEISAYFRQKFDHETHAQMPLRYGLNPHQGNAYAYVKHDSLPFKVRNGAPSYVNMLDALNGWALVKELSQITNLPAAASFKHVSPAGCAIGDDSVLSNNEKILYDLENVSDEISGLTKAYVKARGADRMSSFGDFIALSAKVDELTAMIISREVSDGIIAPGYSTEALNILKSKKKGKYLILEIDPKFCPPRLEYRSVYGIWLQQERNDVRIDQEMVIANIINGKTISKKHANDIILAATTLKYTQSNSVCFAKNGMIIGNGAGQQSRIHCTKLAAAKADLWWLRQHEKVLKLKFSSKVKRPERANAIDIYLSGNVPDNERKHWESLFEEVPEFLTSEEISTWMKKLNGVTCASDAFFPFPDNIHRLKESGVTYIAAPTGSVMDDQVLEAAKDMVFCQLSVRLFHH